MKVGAYILAGVVVISGFGLSLQGETKVKDIVDQNKTAGEKLEEIGSTAADETTATAVRGLLAKTVNDGVTEGKFENLVSDLAKADRDRVGDFKHPKMKDLDAAIAQFRTDFKAKYNQDFEIKPEHFRDALVYAGKDKNSATVALPAFQFDRTSDSGKGSPVLDKVKGAKVDEKVGDKVGSNLVKGETMRPSLTLNLINEGTVVGAWRINIPDEIRGDQLKSNLIKHIQMLDDQKAMWPTDADAAYHAAAYHVLQALSDSALASER